MTMSVEIKSGTCYKNGDQCMYNGMEVCYMCSIHTGNVKNKNLFVPKKLKTANSFK